MGEITNFVARGAAMITPKTLKSVHKKLPFLKLKFTEVDAPAYPHLVDQLEFLASALEDAMEGAYKELPFSTIAQATFALLYAHKKVGVIPDSLLDLGRADDSSVVRAVLIQNEKALGAYASTQGIDLKKITHQP